MGILTLDRDTIAIGDVKALERFLYAVEHGS